MKKIVSLFLKFLRFVSFFVFPNYFVTFSFRFITSSNPELELFFDELQKYIKYGCILGFQAHRMYNSKFCLN